MLRCAFFGDSEAWRVPCVGAKRGIYYLCRSGDIRMCIPGRRRSSSGICGLDAQSTTQSLVFSLSLLFAQMAEQGTVKDQTATPPSLPLPTDHASSGLTQAIDGTASCRQMLNSSTQTDITPRQTPDSAPAQQNLDTAQFCEPETISTSSPETPANEDKPEEAVNQTFSRQLAKALAAVINMVILAAIASAVWKALGSS